MRRSAAPAEPTPVSARRSATPAEPAPVSAQRSATPAGRAPVSACQWAGAPGASLWAFVGMLLVMAGAMVGLGLTG